jgi:formate-dependent nitrite reductase cytochrome c552 subunit
VALHIALFWGIGTFKIKNEDDVKIKLDEEEMFDQLNSKTKINDEFIENKIKFIQSFIKQRKLRVDFEKITPEDNLSNKFLK